MTYNAEVIADAPVYRFTLGEASGTPANTGSASTTSITSSTITLGATGIPGNPTDTAAKFTANTASTVTIILVTFYGTTYTIEAWFNTTSSGATRRVLTILNGSITRSNILLDSSGILYGGRASAEVATASAKNDGNWHHAVAVFNGSNSTFYVDGTSVGTGTLPVSWSTSSPSIRIGAVGISQAIPGTIDEVAIYSTALSSTRIAAHYAAGASAPVPFRGWGIEL